MSYTPEQGVQPEEIQSNSPHKVRDNDIANDDFCRRYLEDHGVSLEYAKACGLKSIPDGWNDKKKRPRIGGLFIDYGGGVWRLRHRKTRVPDEEEGGNIVREGYDLPKFLASPGADVEPYLPPQGMPANWAIDTSADLFFAEGPIKALCMTEHGFPCIGLGGVEAGFHDKKAKAEEGALELHPRLRAIAWTGRTVYIAYDAFRKRNPSVARGEARLALLLKKQGANVFLIALPPDSRMGKDVAAYFDDEQDQGPDDFIKRAGERHLRRIQSRFPGVFQVAAAFEVEVAKRPERAKRHGGQIGFRRLVAAAVPADPVARIQSCDTLERARVVLDELPFQAALRYGGPTVVAEVAKIMQTRFKSGISKVDLRAKVQEFNTRVAAKQKKDAESAQGPQPFLRGDHVEIAEQLVKKLSKGGLVYADGAFHAYSDGVWAVLDEHAVSREVQAFVGAPIQGGAGVLKLKASDVKGATHLAMDRVGKPRFFDNAPAGLAFKNGFVQVAKDGISLQAHSPSNKARFAYPFAYPEAGKQPIRLLAMLDRFFRNDEDKAEKIAFIQEYGGMALIGQGTTGEKILLMLGAGNDGKTTLANVIRAMLPEGSVTAIAPQELGHEYKKAILVGKLANICTEMPERDIIDSSGVKAVTGRDAVLGRHPAGRPFTYIPRAGQFYAANKLPPTSDTSRGFRRRFVIIQFNETITDAEKIDRYEDEIVAAELPAIVGWFLKGAARQTASGRYTIPKSADEAMARWMLRSCSVASFVEEATVPATTPNTFTGAKLLYMAYKTWCQDNGVKNVVAFNSFGERLKGLLGEAGKRHTNKGNLWALQLREAESPVSAAEVAGLIERADDVAVAEVTEPASRRSLRPQLHLVADERAKMDERAEDEDARRSARRAVGDNYDPLDDV